MLDVISARILHIAHDEKFISAADDIFESAYPDCNTFFIIDAEHAKMEFVDPSKENYELFGNTDSDLKAISARLGQYDLVVLHWLDRFKCNLILNNHVQSEFLWMFWGGEIYDDEEIYPLSILGSATRGLLGRKSMYHSLRRLYKSSIRNLHLRRLKYSIKLDAIAKLSLVGISDTAEAQYFKELNILNVQTKPVRFFYYQADRLGPKMLPSTKRRNILVGNSAAYTNNHLEVFQLLSQLELDDQQLIVPLGYSDVEGYVERLSEEAEQLLGDRYAPVHDFMDIKTYQKRIGDCGYAIFNHNRQQALGTILMCFQMGLRVFLNDEGRNCIFFRKLGFHFNLLSDISSKSGILQLPITTSEAENNQRLVEKQCSLEKIIRELRDDLNTYLFSKSKEKILQ